MNDNENLILEAAAQANLLEEANDLVVPILDNFKIVEQSDNHFVALYDNIIEQFYNDGCLEDNETFEERIEKNNNKIKETIKGNKLYDNKETIMYFKSHKTNLLAIKIYLQDIFTEENYFIRQINGYFINPKTNEFCQLSLAIGPYKNQEKYEILENIKDIDNDELIAFLDETIHLVLNNIKFS